MLRSVAAAHVLAGTLEFLKVAGNLLLGLPYTGGPLALPGVVTVLLARVLYGFWQGVLPDSNAWRSGHIGLGTKLQAPESSSPP